MPLTIAHPALVYPFRRCLPLSALMAGSLAPDFEYLLYLSPKSEFSHTALGLIVFCLPSGLLALWIFERIWKRPILALLGKAQDARTGRCIPGSFRRFLVLCFGVLVGSALHLLWDSFTQDYGWFVQHNTRLGQGVRLAGRLELPLYLVLHHISTLLGVGALLILSFYHRTWKLPPFRDHWPLLVIVGWMTIGGGVALGMLVAGDVSTVGGLLRWVGCAGVVASTILVLVITFLSLLWHLHHRIPGSLI